MKRATITCLAILPAALLCALVFSYGVDVPYWDQWQLADFFVKLSEGRLTAADLFAQFNEYREFFPHLVIVALGRLTRWDVRYEMLLIFCLACVVSFNVYRLGGAVAGADSARRLWLAFVSNLLIFSPIQHENWLFGIQIVYFFPLVCVTTCMLVANSGLGAEARFLLCMCLATISTFSSANGILCWVVVLPVLAWREPFRLGVPVRLLLLWTAGFAANAALYFYGYEKPPAHPGLDSALVHPLSAVAYFFSFLGSPLSLGRVYLAAAVGVALATLFLLAWLSLPLLREGPARAALPWLMIGSFSVLTAALVTAGRSGYGVRQSLFSRYTTFSIYLIVALIHLVPLVLDEAAAKKKYAGGRRPGGRLLPALAAALVLWNLPVFYLGARQMSRTRADRRQGKACLLFINLVRHECLTQRMYPDLNFLQRNADALDKLGYLRPALIRSKRVREIEGEGAPAAAYGAFEALTRTAGGYVASGRAVRPGGDGPADAVLIASEDAGGEPLLLALSHAGDDAAGGPVRERGWREFIPADRLPAGTESLTAWAFDANTGKAFRLEGVRRIREDE